MSNNQTHQQILEAAFKLFAEHGIDKTSLAMIAAEVGITKPAIYYHFSSKEALIAFIFEETFRDYTFSHYFKLDEFTKENFETLLVENGLKMLPQEEEEYSVLRVLNEFLLAVSRQDVYQQRLYDIEEDFLLGFTALMEKGVELGVVAPDKISAKAYVLALVIDNLSNFMLMGFNPDVREVWAEAVAGVLIRP
ncbi:TetR/AcrR family transcriptional regulator [Paenibacillus chitinolyticus]|uniref:TetR/AcrR family transcriptional regulator n=1 Tax=Paenibacillus chitinolyticus TaxID=79263 RepID=UPI003D03CFF5